MCDNDKCISCGAPTSFERSHPDEPREGEVCDVCGGWFCHSCVEFVSDCVPICKECLADEVVLERRAWIAAEIKE